MSALRDWQSIATKQQQTFYCYFGDRKCDKVPKDVNTLNTKISFTFFSTSYEKCSTRQKYIINATRKKVSELCGTGDLHFGCIFVSLHPNNSDESRVVPLIRTRHTNHPDVVYFVEAQPGRVYTGWTDYLHNNKLPSGNICYPVDGFYHSRFDQRVNIEFKEIRGKLICGTVLDVASSVGKIASTGLIAASLFCPLSTRLVAAAVTILCTSTAYSTIRGICKIVDQNSHHESVSAADWIEIGAGMINPVLMGGAVVLPHLVASGRLASSMVSTVMKVLNCASVAGNSLGALTNVAILVEKFRSDTLEASDIAYFISGCLFVENIVVNAVVAEKVICSLSNRPGRRPHILKQVYYFIFPPPPPPPHQTGIFGSFDQVRSYLMWPLLSEIRCRGTT